MNRTLFSRAIIVDPAMRFWVVVVITALLLAAVSKGKKKLFQAGFEDCSACLSWAFFWSALPFSSSLHIMFASIVLREGAISVGKSFP